MKKISFILGLSALAVFFLVANSHSQLQAYYSGDAVNYNNSVVVASVNSGKLEVFKLENDSLVKTLELNNFSSVFNINESYSDLKLSIEDGRLYVYAVSQYTLYKYDISPLSSAQLVKQVKNNYWEWYQRVDRLGNDIATLSEKGIKIYNTNLDVVDSYNFSAKNPYSIRSNGSQQYLFAIDNNNIEVYDRGSRTIVRTIPLDFIYQNNNHKAYYDVVSNNIFAIDDTFTKKFDLNGNLLASFRHLEQPGYDVESTYGNPYFYFSNGLGVVKMNKETFKVAAYAYTTDSGGPQGWAMGLKVVNTDQGDVLVVFNGSNILLLNSNLKKISSVKSNTYAVSSSANENLYLNLNHNFALVGGAVTVSGGGFWSQEPLLIKFGTAGFSAQTDNRGRFSTDLTTPNFKPGYYDIKVTGANSLLTYSTSIEVK
ncbi:MAG: hypothetical protein WC467_01580 [Patescibacteria group bacterium]